MKNTLEIYTWEVHKPGIHNTLVDKGTFSNLYHDDRKMKSQATRDCRDKTGIQFSQHGQWERDYKFLHATWFRSIKKGQYKGYRLKLTHCMPQPIMKISFWEAPFWETETQKGEAHAV